MLKAPIPDNESERMENLEGYQILDTPFDQVFDEIAALAGKICGMPYALISLIDRQRQWFKGAYGWTSERETPRDISFCGHAIMQDDVFYVPDAREDERFSDNPLVTGDLSIRLYAGVPLVSQEGHKLGTLCVLSDRPSGLNDWQKECLKQLSHVVTALLKAHRREARLVMISKVVDAIPEEIVLASTKTLRPMYVNATTLERMRRGGKSGRSSTLWDLLQIDQASTAARLVQDVQAGRRERVAIEVPRPTVGGNGETRSVELNVQRLQFGNFDTILSIGHDIEERKKAERQQFLLQEELEHRNQQLSKAYARLSEELALAREMQQRFLPTPKNLSGITFDWLFQASSFLSGDIFDYFPLNDRYVCFHVVDVSGHGVAAALLAFNVQRQMYSSRDEMAFAIHTASDDIAVALPRIVKQFNRRFSAQNPTSMYLTMVCGLLDTQTGKVALVQAGHPHPLLLQSGADSPVSLGGGGVPIGMLDDVDYDAVECHLRPGDRLFLYSDGITESVNAEGKEFGTERLTQLLSEHRGKTLHGVRNAIEDAVTHWNLANQDIYDDITFLALEYMA